jgi:hypothetical protein
MKPTGLRKTSLHLLGGALAMGMLSLAQAADTIKVGVLHSLSGTMAISETTLKDTMLMLIEQQNKKGGVWLLDLRVPQVGLAGIRATERAAVLPGPV